MYVISLTYVLLTIVFLYFLRRYLKIRNVAKYIDKLPGLPAYPFIGSVYPFIGVKAEDTYAIRRRITETYLPLFRTWAGSQAVVHLTKPEHLEIVMNNMTQITKSDFYNALRPWLGDGLLTSDGAKWHRNRKLITPTFHFQILDNFMDVFVEKSQLLVEQLSSEADGKVFDIYPFITHCALDIISETAMGVQINAMAGKNHQYVDAVYGMAQLTSERGLKPWLMYDFLYRMTSRGKQHDKHLKTLHDFTNNVIQERKAALQNRIESEGELSSEDLLLGKKRRMAFLDLLIEASKNGTILSDRDIREEVDTFMFEGHDTTTAGICWSLFLLGNHLDIQDKLYEELSSILGDKAGPETINDLADLKLLERCIKESLRLYPSVPIIIRRLNEDISVDGYKVPAGVMVALHIYDVHRNNEIFPDPERFDPDRFLPEPSKNRHPYSYIPFSAGPRNCIGQKFAMIEEKTILAHILKNFKVQAVENQKTIRKSGELILKPFRGLKLKLEPRVSNM